MTESPCVCVVQDFSFDYNLPTGVSLIMEGIMSSLYHICPTNANFQFGKTLNIHALVHSYVEVLHCV